MTVEKTFRVLDRLVFVGPAYHAGRGEVKGRAMITIDGKTCGEVEIVGEVFDNNKGTSFWAYYSSSLDFFLEEGGDVVLQSI